MAIPPLGGRGTPCMVGGVNGKRACEFKLLFGVIVKRPRKNEKWGPFLRNLRGSTLFFLKIVYITDREGERG